MKKLLLGVVLVGIVSPYGDLFAAKSLETVRRWCDRYRKTEAVYPLREQVYTILSNRKLNDCAKKSERLKGVLSTFSCRNKPENTSTDYLVMQLDRFIENQPLFDGETVGASVLLSRIREGIDNSSLESSGFNVTALRKLLELIDQNNVNCESASSELAAFDLDNVDQEEIDDLHTALSACCKAQRVEMRENEGLGDYDLAQYNCDSDDGDGYYSDDDQDYY